MVPLIGLTGGIGCGKSTVAALFARTGVAVIDTDKIAQDLTAAGGDALFTQISHVADAALDFLSRRLCHSWHGRCGTLRISLEFKLGCSSSSRLLLLPLLVLFIG